MGLDTGGHRPETCHITSNMCTDGINRRLLPDLRHVPDLGLRDPASPGGGAVLDASFLLPPAILPNWEMIWQVPMLEPPVYAICAHVGGDMAGLRSVSASVQPNVKARDTSFMIMASRIELDARNLSI